MAFQKKQECVSGFNFSWSKEVWKEIPDVCNGGVEPSLVRIYLKPNQIFNIKNNQSINQTSKSLKPICKKERETKGIYVDLREACSFPFLSPPPFTKELHHQLCALLAFGTKCNIASLNYFTPLSDFQIENQHCQVLFLGPPACPISLFFFLLFCKFKMPNSHRTGIWVMIALKDNDENNDFYLRLSNSRHLSA